jgi:hypothetical protein
MRDARYPHLSFMTAELPTGERRISLLALGRHVEFTLSDPALITLVAANFGAMIVNRPGRPADLRYSEIRTGTKSSFLLAAPEGRVLRAETPAELVWTLEKDITVALQKARPELLFLHSAAVEFGGNAFGLVASSGTGKSTTTWAVLHHGFRYLSDELSPIDLDALEVHPYAHALCLKQAPPLPYVLGEDVLDLGRTLHVPAQSLPGGIVQAPRRLAAIFMLDRDSRRPRPLLQRVGCAEAAARLYANALNPLAHPNLGIDAALHIAERLPCFLLSLADLRATCGLLKEAAAAAAAPSQVISQRAWSGIC